MTLVAASAPVLASEYDEDEAVSDLASPLVFADEAAEPAPEFDAVPESDFGFDGDLDLTAASAVQALSLIHI